MGIENLYPSAAPAPTAPPPPPAPTPAPTPAPAPAAPGQDAPAPGSADTPPAAPAAPVEYAVEFPEGVQVPEGWAIDPADPLLGVAKEFAAAHGLDQKGFSELLGLRAKLLMSEQDQRDAQIAAELGKLGDRGRDRVRTVNAFLKSKLPADQFAALESSIMNAAGIEAIETLMTMVNGPVLPASLPPAPPPPPSPLASLYPTSNR